MRNGKVYMSLHISFLPKFEFCDELSSPLLGFIINANWYTANHKELVEWCTEHDITVATSGMFIVPDMATRTLFTLRWA